jgi:hypothetical protein
VTCGLGGCCDSKTHYCHDKGDGTGPTCVELNAAAMAIAARDQFCFRSVKNGHEYCTNS